MTNPTPRTSFFRLFVDATFTLTVIGAAVFFGLKKWNPELLAALPGLSVSASEITDEELAAVAEKPLIPDGAILNPDQIPEPRSSVNPEPESEWEQAGFVPPQFEPRFQPPCPHVRRQPPCQHSRQPAYRVVIYRRGGCR